MRRRGDSVIVLLVAWTSRAMLADAVTAAVWARGDPDLFRATRRQRAPATLPERALGMALA
jgi:hypothetical protein